MNGKRITLIMALFILLMVGQTAYAYADTYIPHLEVSKKNYYFTAGKQNQLTLVLNNSGGYDIFEVQAILTSNTPGITILSKSIATFLFVGSL